MKKFFFISVFYFFASLQVHAQSELPVKSVSIFKNGKSFVVKEGTVAATDKVYTMDSLPGALFGTFWFTGLQADIAKVVCEQDSVTETVDKKAAGFTELLYANKGKQITLTTTDDKSFTGTIEDFDLPERNNLSPTLLLKTNTQWLTVRPENIRTIVFSEKPEQKASVKTKVVKPQIKVYFTQGGAQPLDVMYLQNGISWTPTYLLQLLSDTTARLRLQAEVTNDAEDLKNVSMNFVVGVPNFKFATSPATLTSFIQKVYDETYSEGRFSNQVMDAKIMEDAVVQDKSTNDQQEDVEAEASEDLYFYNIKNVDLEKGGRAHYPLLNTIVKIKHLYECNLPAATDERRYYNNDEENDNGDGTFSFNTMYSNVYHSIEIRNDTKTPFTTGPVFFVQGETQNPLAQDMMKYTGSGTSSAIQLTRSPDVRVEEKEKIISTQENMKKRNGYTYALVTVQSEVSITNSKSKEIELAIGKIISGKSQDASIKYEKTQQTAGINNINPTEYLKFGLKLKAGEKQKFTYTYSVYVRR